MAPSPIVQNRGQLLLSAGSEAICPPNNETLCGPNYSRLYCICHLDTTVTPLTQKNVPRYGFLSTGSQPPATVGQEDPLCFKDTEPILVGQVFGGGGEQVLNKAATPTAPHTRCTRVSAVRGPHFPPAEGLSPESA